MLNKKKFGRDVKYFLELFWKLGDVCPPMSELVKKKTIKLRLIDFSQFLMVCFMGSGMSYEFQNHKFLKPSLAFFQRIIFFDPRINEVISAFENFRAFSGAWSKPYIRCGSNGFWKTCLVATAHWPIGSGNEIIQFF